MTDKPATAIDVMNISTFELAKKSAIDHYQQYISVAEIKRVNAQGASEITFYGAAVAAVAGVTKAVTTAIVGGVTGAGASIYSERYQLITQATNYEAAADVMKCLYLASSDLSDEGLKTVKISYADGSTSLADKALKEVLIRAILTTKNRLYKLQASMTLASPDLNSIINIIKNQKDNSSAADGTAKALDVATKDKVDAYRNSTNLCLSKIAG